MITDVECRNGHRYTEENTYHHPGGWRRCRQCDRDTQNVRRAKEQAEDMAAKRVTVTIMPRPVNYDTEAWRDNAACATIGGDLWFPDNDRHAAGRAKEVCDTKCKVRDICLRWALENDEREGIWGGLSPQERKQLRRSA